MADETPKYRTNKNFYDGISRHRASPQEPYDFRWPKDKEPSLTWTPLNQAAKAQLEELSAKKKSILESKGKRGDRIKDRAFRRLQVKDIPTDGEHDLPMAGVAPKAPEKIAMAEALPKAASGRNKGKTSREADKSPA